MRDVVEKMISSNHRITIVEDEGFFSAQDLQKKLEMLAKYVKEVMAILIVPPDKAMLIFMKGGKLGLIDSHEQGANWAIIATSCNISNFVDYLNSMVHRYWNTTLSGPNLAIIESQIEE